MTAPVFRPSPEQTTVELHRRVKALEGNAVVWPWLYLTPVAPASTPPDYDPAEPLYPPFENSWANLAAHQACSFRLQFRNQSLESVKMRGALTGGSLPSVVFTLPAGYRPALSQQILVPGTDGTTIYTGRVDPDGSVWLLAAIS